VAAIPKDLLDRRVEITGRSQDDHQPNSGQCLHGRLRGLESSDLERAAELSAEVSQDEKLRPAAAKVVEELTTSQKFAEFLTLASSNLLD
jgi:hypothetical protein